MQVKIICVMLALLLADEMKILQQSQEIKHADKIGVTVNVSISNSYH